MNFYEMYTRVQNYINDDSAATLILIKETINQKAKELMQKGFMRFAMRDTTLTTTTSTTDYYLPTDLEKIIDMRQTAAPIQLQRAWIGNFDKLIPNPTATGSPKVYMELLEDRIAAQPTTSNKVIISSNSDSDVSPETGSTQVTIAGTVSGEDMSEVVLLSAKNVLSSVNAYDKLYSITADLPPVGTLRFTQHTVFTELLELFPNQTYKVYKKVKFHPIPDGTYTIYIRYQARHANMVNTSDTTIIPDRYHDILVNSVIGDLLLKQGDSKAPAWIQTSEAGVRRMLMDQDIHYDFTPSIQTPLSRSNTDGYYPFSRY